MMMGPVGNDVGMPRGGPDRMDGPGKKMQAVGQQAKMAVAAAREAGVELPKNAQGLAASGLARGADPASLFASLVADPEPMDPVVDPDPVSDPVSPPETDVADVAEDGVEVPQVSVDDLLPEDDEA